jgi:hypothetical protein
MAILDLWARLALSAAIVAIVVMLAAEGVALYESITHARRMRRVMQRGR